MDRVRGISGVHEFIRTNIQAGQSFVIAQSIGVRFMNKRLLMLSGLAITAVAVNHAANWGFIALFWWTDRYRAVAVPNYDQPVICGPLDRVSIVIR